MSNDQPRPIDAAIARLRATYTPSAGRPSEDVAERLPDDPAPDSAVPMAEELFWPPPRLEPLHGKLTSLAYEFAIGSGILLMAFAYTSAAPAVLSVAFLFLCLAFARLRQMLLHVHNAIGIGYPRRLLWQVAADSYGQMPFLLEGKGAFTGITQAESMRLAQQRVTSATLFLLGMLWIPLVFPWIVVLGFAGVLRDPLVWLLLLGIPTALVIAGMRVRVQEWKALRAFRMPEALHHETAMQVAAWNVLHSRVGWGRGKEKGAAEIRIAMGAVWLAAFFLLLPIALAGVMNIIPRFVSSSAASEATTVRAAMLSALHDYRIPTDSSVSPVAAGQALHSLNMIGRADAPPMVQRATVTLAPVFSNRRFTRETNPEFWPEELFGWIRARSLTPERRALVDSAAAHPANALLSVIARAPGINVTATRFHLDMADTTALRQLPYVFSREIRNVAHAHVAQAAKAMQQGDVARADTTLREIVSAGFALRNSADAMDAVNGTQMVRIGAIALASLYQETGREREAGEIRGSVRAADIATSGVAFRSSRSIDELRRYVLLKRNPVAARWDTFIALQTAAPCLSFYSAVFGPDDEHKRWVRDARSALVQTPADSAYFELVAKGAAVKRASEEPRCSRSVLRGYREILMGY